MLPDEELTMTLKPYTGKEFRIDGYYIGTSNFTGKNDKNYNNYKFFYSNGLVFSSYSYDINGKIYDITEIIADMERNRNKKDLWGVFKLEENEILTQGWVNSASAAVIGNDRLYSLINGYYKIINDTTILYKNCTGYITLDLNEYYYHFKKFSPKPDSTNTFIK
jgi:hypothetical protein